MKAGEKLMQKLDENIVRNALTISWQNLTEHWQASLCEAVSDVNNQ